MILPCIGVTMIYTRASRQGGSTAIGRRPSPRGPRTATSPRQEGFSLLELLVAMTLVTIVMGIGFSGFRNYRGATVVDRAVEAVAGDVRLARSFAIQRRSDVAIVVDEAARSYALRVEATSDTLLQRRFDAASDLPLTLLDVVDGNSLTFDARGILTTTGTARIDLGAGDRQSSISISKLGRTKVDRSP